VHPRQRAQIAGEVFYETGIPCRHGHIAKRYTISGHCFVCQCPTGGKPGGPKRREIRQCVRCGEAFEVRKADAKIHCSCRCANADSSSGAKKSGSKICGVCSVTFLAKPAERYCSDECRRTAIINGQTFEKYFRRILQIGRRYRFISKTDCAAILARQNGKCAISGETLTCETKQGVVNTNASLDRIDSSLGYTLDNVQLVCRIINVMKTDLSMDAFREWCKKVAFHSPEADR